MTEANRRKMDASTAKIEAEGRVDEEREALLAQRERILAYLPVAYAEIDRREKELGDFYEWVRGEEEAAEMLEFEAWLLAARNGNNQPRWRKKEET